MSNDRRLTLFELNQLVREVIECEMPNEYWVEAELSECRESRGHCYMELIQKDERNNTPIAKATARCWMSKWSMIRPYFERTTGQMLHAGMKVLLKVYPNFHEAYGFSWIVTDIDPNYTLGDMARQRQEIIRQLKAEGVFDLQKELQLPRFCQRIAIISSEKAAGYGDFCHQLHDNPYGFIFYTRLFPAVMQGEEVERSIIGALEQIYTLTADYSSTLFDCVVIIRGGGATSDMSGFDTLALAENVANFPIPIITGIGHDRDECILDMVSHIRVKTPTAAATLLISNLKTVCDAINDMQERITSLTQQRIADYRLRLTHLQTTIPRLFPVIKARHETQLDALSHRVSTNVLQRVLTQKSQLASLEERLPMVIRNRLTQQQHLLEMAQEKLKNLDPILLLHRGYSITLKDGKAVKDPQSLQPGDEIETRLSKGTIKSIIT